MALILPSVTTIGLTNSSWRQKISEISALDIYEISLFLTGLKVGERISCYQALEAAQEKHNFSIPFIHATSSMPEEEFWYLKSRFKTKYFNLHPTWEYPLEHELSKEIRSFILIENSSPSQSLCKEDLEGFAGICFDLSHLEDSRRSKPEVYEENLFLAKQYEVLANHISAVSDLQRHTSNNIACYSVHNATLGHFHYLSHIAKVAFSDLCAIELENSLNVQLIAKEQIIQSLDICRIKLAA